jgi:predicted  nucleic acid-binding Zn-ribbon protein
MKKDLFKELEDDLTLTPINLQDKLYEIPKMYNKWQRIYFENKKKLNKKVKELDELYKSKYYYYKDGDRLLDNQKEINFNVISDKEYNALRIEVENLKDLVKVLEQSVDRIGKMSFDVKNIIAWNQFLSGN